MKTHAVHHAIVFEGDRVASLDEAKRYIEVTLTIPIEANPDVSIHDIEKYGVSDARALKARASQTPLGQSQAFLLAIDSITHEAQNALLKLLEEPADNTYFVLVVPSIHILLPTVRSRLAYGKRAVGQPLEQKQAREFLTSTPKERVRLVSTYIENKDRKGARDMLDAIEGQLHNTGVKENHQALSEVAFVRRYISDRSSSLKMLLEHLAITI